MHFVFHEVRQFQHIGIANGNGMIKWLARSSIVELYFPALWQASAAQHLFDIFFGRSIKDRGGDLKAKHIGCPAQMRLHDLSDIHAVRHAQRIQDDIHWRSIRQEWHIFNWQHARDNAFVSVSSGHLVARANLTFLRDADAHQLVHARRQFIARVTREDFDLDYLTTLTVWDAQRRIFDFPSLLTEDGAQQFLFRRQFRLTLGGDLAYQDILWPHFRADIDDAPLVQVTQSFFTNVGNITRNLFRPQFGIARIHLILFNMDRRKEVFSYDALADQNGVFEVATLPAHKGYQDVLSQRQFAFFCRG